MISIAFPDVLYITIALLCENASTKVISWAVFSYPTCTVADVTQEYESFA